MASHVLPLLWLRASDKPWDLFHIYTVSTMWMCHPKKEHTLPMYPCTLQHFKRQRPTTTDAQWNWSSVGWSRIRRSATNAGSCSRLMIRLKDCNKQNGMLNPWPLTISFPSDSAPMIGQGAESARHGQRMLWTQMYDGNHELQFEIVQACVARLHSEAI